MNERLWTPLFDRHWPKGVFMVQHTHQSRQFAPFDEIPIMVECDFVRQQRRARLQSARGGAIAGDIAPRQRPELSACRCNRDQLSHETVASVLRRCNGSGWDSESKCLLGLPRLTSFDAFRIVHSEHCRCLDKTGTRVRLIVRSESFKQNPRPAIFFWSWCRALVAVLHSHRHQFRMDPERKISVPRQRCLLSTV